MKRNEEEKVVDMEITNINGGLEEKLNEIMKEVEASGIINAESDINYNNNDVVDDLVWDLDDMGELEVAKDVTIGNWGDLNHEGDGMWREWEFHDDHGHDYDHYDYEYDPWMGHTSIDIENYQKEIAPRVEEDWVIDNLWTFDDLPNSNNNNNNAPNL